MAAYADKYLHHAAGAEAWGAVLPEEKSALPGGAGVLT